MSGTSLRAVSEVVLILFEDSVEFFISRCIPSGNIVHLFATDANIQTTDTNNAQTWKLSKRYTNATQQTDVIYVRVTCSTGSVPTPPFFTIAYTYYVNVVDARFNVPSRELVLLTNVYSTENARTMEYLYDLPEKVGDLTVNPSTTDDPNPLSTFVTDSSSSAITYGPEYGNPVATIVYDEVTLRSKLKIVQNFEVAGTNSVSVTLLYNRYNAYRTYIFTYVVIQVNSLRINGYAAAPFLIDMLSYDTLTKSKIAARYIHNAMQSSTNIILNNDVAIHDTLGSTTAILPSNTYYNVSVSNAVDNLVNNLDEFPLVKFRRENDFVNIELDNQSSTAKYQCCITRSITFDNGSYIRCDPLINKLFGFIDETMTSAQDVVTGLQTIKSGQTFTRVVPPVISLELDLIANQQEGIIRQAESVRLFNFLMLDEDTGYKTFDNSMHFPHRVLLPNSNKTKILRFNFVYNRMAEVQNIDTNGIPVQFLEPYYITLRLQFRLPRPVSQTPNGKIDYELQDSFITLTGTESSKEVVLGQAVTGIQMVEICEARMPKQAEAVATPNGRRAILGYVIDTSLFDGSS